MADQEILSRAADPGLGEGRHAGMAGDGGLEDADGEGRARGLAEPHAEIEQRRACRSCRAAGGGRARPRHGRRRNGRARAGRRRSSTAAAAVAAKPSSTTGTRPRRAAMMAPAIAASSQPAEPAQHVERIAACRRWRSTAAATTASLWSSTAPATPVPGPIHSAALPPKSAQAQRRRRGGVGDPHLAERQDVEPGLDRHHAVGDRLGAVLARSSPGRRRNRRSAGRGSSRRRADRRRRPGRAGSPPRRRR